MQHGTYEEAFAYWAPIMRARWRASNAAKRRYARADIVDTLRLHTERSPYAGKLMAELDAIRDAEMAYQRAYKREREEA